jgi:hypothetical protein
MSRDLKIIVANGAVWLRPVHEYSCQRMKVGKIAQ